MQIFLVNLCCILGTIEFLKPSYFYRIRESVWQFRLLAVTCGCIGGWTIGKVSMATSFNEVILVGLLPAVCFVASFVPVLFYPNVWGWSRDVWAAKVKSCDPELIPMLSPVVENEWLSQSIRDEVLKRYFFFIVYRQRGELFLVFFDSRHIPPRELLDVDMSNLRQVNMNLVSKFAPFPAFF